MPYRELLREGAEPGRLPPVLPVVLYNGDSRWPTGVRELVLYAGPALARTSRRSAMWCLTSGTPRRTMGA